MLLCPSLLSLVHGRASLLVYFAILARNGDGRRSKFQELPCVLLFFLCTRVSIVRDGNVLERTQKTQNLKKSCKMNSLFIYFFQAAEANSNGGGGTKVVQDGPPASSPQPPPAPRKTTKGRLVISRQSMETAFAAVCKAYVPRPGQPMSRTREEVTALAQASVCYRCCCCCSRLRYSLQASVARCCQWRGNSPQGETDNMVFVPLSALCCYVLELDPPPLSLSSASLVLMVDVDVPNTMRTARQA